MNLKNLIFGKDGRLERLTDRELVARCLAGEAEAWDALIARYNSLIYTVGLREGLSSADAEDIFQEVCLLMLRYLANLRDVDRLAGWLIATTRREAWRLRKRRAPLLESELEQGSTTMETARPASDLAPSPEKAVLELENQWMVQQALQNLPDKCRNLLTLIFCGDPPLSYAEAAERLSIPLGSIGPVRARCLQRLKKNLEESGY